MIFGLLQNPAPAQHAAGGEAALVLPGSEPGHLLRMGGRGLLLWGLVVCALGLLFGLAQYTQAPQSPRAPRDAGNLRADLRDL